MTLVQQERKKELVELMGELDVHLLLLYGNGWRKDFVRLVLDIDYLGTDAAVGLRPSGELFVIVTDPWDAECIGDEAEVLESFDLQAALEELGDEKVAIAGMEQMEARFVQAFRKEPRSATQAVELLRLVKLPNEIAAMERAAELADLGYEVFRETAREGIPEYELVAEVEGFLKSRGAEDNFMLISSGGPEVRGMKPPTERELSKGDVVATELTPCVDGFYAQICRTLIVGEPSQAQNDAFDIYYRAQKAAVDILKPGVNISDVARAENDVFREAGLGEYTTSKYTRVRGHGLGRFVDEYPHVLEETDCVVREGMTLIAHPNTYLPTAGYMVFGDALVVTESGCRSLAKTEKRLFQAGSGS